MAIRMWNTTIRAGIVIAATGAVVIAAAFFFNAVLPSVGANIGAGLLYLGGIALSAVGVTCIVIGAASAWLHRRGPRR